MYIYMYINLYFEIKGNHGHKRVSFVLIFVIIQ